jgi:2-polyprenyl-3-methyl-5-hydroxy-6-metoxy-1,4-benzoquinol methylase
VRSGESVLDIGCSTGTLLTEICATWGADGVGVDLSPGSIGIAQEFNPLRLEYYVASAEALPFADREFDHVLCMDVLEHTARPDVAIREVYRCLKPGGTALFHVPVSDVRYSFDWWLARFGPEILAERMAAVGHDYARMLSGPELLGAFSRAGFDVQRAERFNVLLQNLFDYHLMIFHRILGLVFQRGVRLGSRRHPLHFSIYHRGVAPVIEWLTSPDRLLAKAGIGASMYCLVTKDVVS